MHKTFIAGAGTIGTLIATLLVNCGDYEVYLVDTNISHLTLPAYKNLHLFQLDVKDSQQLKQFLLSNNITIAISSLPFFYNILVANVASELNLHYFDLTEDINVSSEV